MKGACWCGSNKMIEEVKKIVEKAGDAIMAIYCSDNPMEVTEKSDASPLTMADLAAHHVIVDGLKNLDTVYPVLSEESSAISVDERQGWSKYWLVDPLDGTKEFIKKNGEFTVNVALVENGKPLLGVVYAPVLNKYYLGEVGHGATLISDGREQVIECRKPAIDGEIKVVASRSHSGPDLDAFLQKMGSHQKVSIGSSLKLCMVASGEADIYPRLGPTMEWDTAAAHAVVLAAGGTVSDLQGETLTYNKDDLLNPHFVVHHPEYVTWKSLLS